MSTDPKDPSWAVELIRQVPAPAICFVAAYFLFKAQILMPGWIALTAALIYLGWLFRIESYERTLRAQHRNMQAQDNRIAQFSKLALDATRGSQETLTKTNVSLGESATLKASGYKTETSTGTNVE